MCAFQIMDLQWCQPPGMRTMGPLKLVNGTVRAAWGLQSCPSILSLKIVLSNTDVIGPCFLNHIRFLEVKEINTLIVGIGEL